MVTPTHAEVRQAEGKIQIGMLRLAGKYVFHVAILERFKVISRPDVGTMAVTVRKGQLVLYHNPAFVLSVSADEQAGVLLHEVHHVVLKHVLADPADFPDEWARTMAEEVTVNEFIVEPL